MQRSEHLHLVFTVTLQNECNILYYDLVLTWGNHYAYGKEQLIKCKNMKICKIPLLHEAASNMIYYRNTLWRFLIHIQINSWFKQFRITHQKASDKRVHGLYFSSVGIFKFKYNKKYQLRMLVQEQAFTLIFFKIDCLYLQVKNKFRTRNYIFFFYLNKIQVVFCNVDSSNY